jgi:hypothetical protein
MKEPVKIRIWVEDSSKPKGGTWCYGEVDNRGKFTAYDFQYTDIDDIAPIEENLVNFWNYKAEII